MSLATILQKIDAEAEASVQKILAQANAEAARIVEQAQVEAEAEAAAIVQRADEDARSFAQRQLAAAQLQARNQKLEHRQRMLEDVRARALKRILACDDAQFTTMMRAVLLAVDEEQAGEIVPAEADAALLSDEFLADLKAALKKQNRKLRYTRSARTAAIPRGVIIDFHDFELDFALENILAGVWAQIKPDVAAQLFDHGKN
jgi:V/A-type H+/Na+-transporting ATPase subunit E